MLLLFEVLLIAVLIDLMRYFGPALCIRKRNVRAVCNEITCRLRPETVTIRSPVPFVYAGGVPLSYHERCTQEGMRIRRMHRGRFFMTSMTVWLLLLYLLLRFFLIPHVIGKTVSQSIGMMNRLDSVTASLTDEKHAEKYYLHYIEKPAGDRSQNILLIGFDSGYRSDLMYLLHIGNEPERTAQKCTLTALQRDIAVQPINVFQIPAKESGLTQDALLYDVMKDSYTTNLEKDTICKLNETTQFYDRDLYGMQDKEAAKAHSRCRSLVLNVEKAFDIYVDHYVLIDYSSVVYFVDAFGGMDYVISDAVLQGVQNVLEIQNELLGRADVIEHSGRQHINGNVLLALIRARKYENDGSNRARTVKVMDLMLSFVKQKVFDVMKNGVGFYMNTPEMANCLGMVYTDMDDEEAERLEEILCGLQHYSVSYGKTLPQQNQYEDYESPEDHKMYVITGRFPGLHEQYEEVIS